MKTNRHTTIRTIATTAALGALIVAGSAANTWARGGESGFGGESSHGGFGAGAGGGYMGHGGGGRGFGMLHELRDLDLTDAQKADVKTVLEGRREAIHATMRDVMEAHRALRDAVKAAKTDEAAIRALATKLGEAEGDAAVLHAQVGQQIRAILTADQIQQLEAARAERQQRRMERRLERQRDGEADGAADGAGSAL